MNGREGSEPVLVCSSDAASIIDQASQLRRLAGRAVIEGRRTPTGARFRFRASPEVEATVRKFVRWEANCCPFLDFSIDTDAGEIRIDVKAPSEAEAILDLLVAVTEAPGPKATTPAASSSPQVAP